MNDLQTVFQLPNKTKLFLAVKKLSVNILNNKTMGSRFLSVEEIEYRSDDVTKMIFLKLWDMMSYSYRGS